MPVSSSDAVPGEGGTCLHRAPAKVRHRPGTSRWHGGGLGPGWPGACTASLQGCCAQARGACSLQPPWVPLCPKPGPHLPCADQCSMGSFRPRSLALHRGWAGWRPRCHAGMVPFLSRGRRKEEELRVPHAKAALWLPTSQQGHGQAKQQLPWLLAMGVPKQYHQGHPSSTVGQGELCESPGSSLWLCSLQALRNPEERQVCAQRGSTTSWAARAGRG